MTDEITLGANNFKWLKDADTTGLTLFRSNYSYGVYSLGESYGSQFSVPAGKKLIILKMGFFGDSDNMQIYDSTSADSATGTKLYDTRDSTAQDYSIDCYIEIATGHYVNVEVPDPKQVQVCALCILTST